MSTNTSGFPLKAPENTNWEEHNAVGDIDGGRRFKAVQNVPMKVIEKTDNAVSTITYYGFAKPGTATSSALWRILREDTSTGVLDFADSDDLFDNVFDDRESLSYG